MKKKELYTCEICCTDYADKENALNCEKGHRVIAETEGKFNAISNNGEYPKVINVKFDNGTTLQYKR